MQVLSSLSGITFYAPSAGFAPTNGADVSAIASAYQVVSSTATQLYAGTSYLTSVNEAPISAERAGQAANASLATSAWYDGTGRFISALPDSAAVSSIASAYAESAASSKQDTLSFAYNTADQISSINGSALGGMDEAAVSSIASAYAESAASGKLDSSASSSFYTTANESGFITGVDLSPYQTTADMSSYIPTSMSSDFQQVTGMSSYVPYSSIGYNTASAISGINGSALAGTTYSAGTGIDITDDVISVETPVDIVAGPGIVIDNPDGNTLRVSCASAYETVLWSASGYAVGDSAQNITLSESPLNFNTIRVYGYRPLSTGAYGATFSNDMDVQWLKTCSVNQVSFPYTINAGSYYLGSLEISGISSTSWKESGWHVVVSNTAHTGMAGVYAHVHKIVGIHRTASN